MDTDRDLTHRLDDLAVAAYRRLVEAGDRDDEWLSEVSGASLERIDEVYRCLARLQVIEPHAEDAGAWRAVSPHIAMAKLVAPLDADVRLRASQAEHLRTQLELLVPVHEATRDSASSQAIEVVADEQELAAVLHREISRCRGSLVMLRPSLCQPGPTRDDVLDARRRGVRVRSVHQHTARYHLPTQGTVEALAAAGTEFRTTDELPLSMMIFDDSTCVLPTYRPLEDEEPPGGEQGDAAVVLRHPLVAAPLGVVFETTWDQSMPMTPADPQPPWVPDEVKRTILRLLATGAKDEVVARRLGVSVRTCRRHISDLMQSLGANSRFQAGVQARLHGLVEPPSGDADLLGNA